MQPPRPSPPPQVRLASQHAMTLVEIMVVIGISMLVLGGVFGFFIQSLKIYHYDTGKLLVNRDMRKFTSELTDNATYANYFLVYPSFTNRSVTVNGTTADNKVYPGLSGNMLVLVYLDPADTTKISRLVGYYREPVGEALEAPVRKFDRTISPSSSAKVYTLLPDPSTAQTNPEVIELSKNIGSLDLFYNFYGRSILVKCEIIHHTGTGANRYERATNTYNFTISPRG